MTASPLPSIVYVCVRVIMKVYKRGVNGINVSSLSLVSYNFHLKLFYIVNHKNLSKVSSFAIFVIDSFKKALD
jgi:hypothetical protein